ncbi:lipase family protein [Actinomadura sp. ATCC 31491]|uniref:Lipase family protein n=1 Tax=Actinomadura luzonensis TaxID=2805427 RepID=A0ABT0FYS4_9ACTN|nr:lipase family protein [Actinomadura luzonensis]MCK2217095.1 lipase family protein [Actinomadura luzonensis]
MTSTTTARRRRVLGALAALLAVAALQAPARAQATTPAERPPGTLLSAEPLPAGLWLPGSGAAYRLTYTSTPATGFSADPVVDVGALFVPAGRVAPAGGWPVVSWAHGTIGVADPCDQTVAGRSQRDIDYLSAWLRAGYAVAATEYEGIGTPRPHPYLLGVSEAYGVVDVVRAARQVATKTPLSAKWLAVGQSQGAQAALFTGDLQRRYAPELAYLGTIATAPPSQWRTTVAAARPFDPAAPANPFVLLAMEGMLTDHPDTFDPARHLTPAGLQLFGAARDELCFGALAQRMAGLTSGQVFDVDAAEQETLTQLLEHDAEIPIAAQERPVFIAQGTADTVVLPPATRTTAGLLAAAGTDVTFRFYQGADHNGVLAAALPDLLAWAADRLRDLP